MKKLILSAVALLLIVAGSIALEKHLKPADELGEAYTLSILDDHTILFTSEESGDKFKMSVEDSSCLEENSRIFIKR